MSANHRPQAIGRHLLSATPLILTISMLTFFVHSAGWLDWAETLGLDFFTHLRAPITPQHTLVVEITDEDYSVLFQHVSPLNTSVLSDLIAKIAAFRPRVIGVDIDTHLSTGWDKLSADWAGHVPIVWAQWPTPIQENGRTVLQPSAVLGGMHPAPCLDEVGIGSMPLEEDGRIRRYARTLPIPHRETNSLPWSVTKQFCLEVFADESAEAPLVKQCETVFASEDSEVFHEQQVLPFARRPGKVNVRELLETKDPASLDRLREKIAGHAVLLGGSYSGVDDHFTPDGSRLGVELMAQAVESELQGRLISPAQEKLMVLVEILGGYGLAAWHFWSHRRVSSWLGRGVVPVFFLLVSVSLFCSLDYWANFAPVLVGVSLHEIWGKSREEKAPRRKAAGHG